MELFAYTAMPYHPGSGIGVTNEEATITSEVLL